MANNYFTLTGVINLVKITDIIEATFGMFNLSKDYPGDGEHMISYESEGDSDAFENLFDSLKNVASNLGAIETSPEEEPELDDFATEEEFGDYFKGLLTKIKAAITGEDPAKDAAFQHFLDTFMETQSKDEGVSFAFVFNLAKVLDDGHGLQYMKTQSEWHSDRTRLFEFGGDGYFKGTHFQVYESSPSTVDFGHGVESLISENKLDDASKEIHKQFKSMIDGIKSPVVKAVIKNKLIDLLKSEE